MKKLYFLLGSVLFLGHSATAQLARITPLTGDSPSAAHVSAEAPAVVISPDSVFAAPDVLPQFVGGAPALHAYLDKNLRYPDAAQRQHIAGKAFVRFVINAQGKVSDVSVVRSPGHGLDEEAMRLMWFMPTWAPGRHQGKPVKTVCTMAINFEE